MAICKTLLASLYGLITSFRNWLFDCGIFPAYQAKVPVISVGNITAGGNGKTPLVLFLANVLKQEGFSPVVISRGYGGTAIGPHLVTDQDTPQTVGDEVCMIRDRIHVPVIVARKRVEGVQYLEHNQVGDVVILDDGFQHRWVKRDLDIVCFSVLDDESFQEIREGALLPQGRFREDKARALKRADSVVFINRSVISNRLNVPTDIVEELPGNVSILNASFASPVISKLKSETQLTPQPIFLFCGIANPKGVETSLVHLGFTIIGKKIFSDHHAYTQNDWNSIQTAAGSYPIVCTEKDGVKIARIDSADPYIFSVSLEMEDKEALLKLILSKMSVPQKQNQNIS